MSVVVLGLGISFLNYVRNEPLRCNKITITSQIVAETFVEVRECLVRSTEPKKTFVVDQSEGGDGATAMALAILIHKHHWDVEVIGVCPSSCANWIFPAGKTKYLHRDSLLLFHGGPYQANLQEMEKALDQSLVNGTPAAAVTLGEPNKEGTVTFTPGPKSKATLEVLRFLSWPEDMSAIEYFDHMRSTSDQLYKELGVNPLMSIYGQIGAYEPVYKSYKYDGFTYSLESLRRLGIGNIELAEGKWHPELNPVWPKVYEVTYP